MDGNRDWNGREEASRGEAFSRPPVSEPILIDAPDPHDAPVFTAPPPRKRRTKLPLVLFVLTCLSTYFVGGLTYSVAVMSILMAHEMGHFLQSVRYGVPASLPFFIPMPFSPLGTMGAVIVQRAGVADRKSLFDIAISGPLAGLVIAIPVTWWGISHSRIEAVPAGAAVFGNPLLVEWMVAYIHRPLQPGEDIILTPMLMAGWVGIFITGLNLIPVGQLDGGHILYALLLRKAHVFTRFIFLAAVSAVIYGSLFVSEQHSGWTVMLFLLWLMGTQHPPTANDRIPLGAFRTVLGWLTLLFIFIGFTPRPMYESSPPPKPKPPAVERPIEVV